MNTIAAIPTKYRNVQFRSRLEARWACFFDLIGWRWDYEPIDLDGYIPDFIMSFHKPLLIEVKPVLEATEFGDHQAKIDRSGWTGEAVVVGALLMDAVYFDGATLGRMRQMMPGGEPCWDDAPFHTCLACNRTSFHHATQSFFCRVCGEADGDHLLSPAPDDLRQMWDEAGNTVQWKGVRS